MKVKMSECAQAHYPALAPPKNDDAKKTLRHPLSNQPGKVCDKEEELHTV